MKRLSFIFAVLLVLSGILPGILGSTAFARCPTWPNCRGDEPPPPVPFISYGDVQLKCIHSRYLENDTVVKLYVNGINPRNPNVQGFMTGGYADRIAERNTIIRDGRAMTAFVIVPPYDGSAEGTIGMALSADGYRYTVISRDFNINSCLENERGWIYE